MNPADDIKGVPHTNSIVSWKTMPIDSLRFAVNLIILKLKVTKGLRTSVGITCLGLCGGTY